MRDKWNDLREALAKYDEHGYILDAVGTDTEFAAWSAMEKMLGEKCGLALYQATSEINSLENCLLARPVYWTREDFIHHVAFREVTP